MKPRIRSYCGEPLYGERYTLAVQDAVLRSTTLGMGEGFSGLVAVSFDESASVESVCYAKFGDRFTDEQLQRMARSVGRVPVPSVLDCFSGHRFEMELAPGPEHPPIVDKSTLMKKKKQRK